MHRPNSFLLPLSSYIQYSTVCRNHQNESQVLPREIVVVKEQPLVEIFRQMGDWWVYDDGSDAAQDETTNEADTVWTWTQQNTAPSGSDSGSDTDDGPGATRIIARVIQPVIRLGSRVIEEGKRFRVSGWTTTAGLAGSENIEPVSSGVDKAAEADATTAGRIEAFRFLQFDVVQSPPDHHYLDTSGQVRN
jgi:ubiquitin-conjugating enzyme E2 O